MPNYALVRNDIVENIVVCDSLENAEQIFPTYKVVLVPSKEESGVENLHLYHANIGLKYNEVDGFEQHSLPDEDPTPVE